MREALRWLARNLGLMVLSLVAAILLWSVAIGQENPIQERWLTQPVPLLIEEPPPGLIVTGEVQQSVRVRIRAPESVWNNLQPPDVLAAVDLAGVEEGEAYLPVEVTVLAQPARVIETRPDHVRLTLEQASQMEVPIQVITEGSPALGYVAHPPVVRSSYAAVYGAATQVSRVVQVVASVPIQSARESIEGEFTLVALGASGEPVTGVQIIPAKVNVQVPIEQLGNYRNLSVRVELTGTVAPGYRIANVRVEPPLVTVFGRPALINELPGYIETEPVSVQDARQDVAVDAGLQLPLGLSLLETQTVQVLVDVEPIEDSLAIEKSVGIQGVTQGLLASCSPPSVEVILSGPLPRLNALSVSVYVDVSGLPAGIYYLAPQIITPEGVTANSVLPASVQVEIVPRPTPTPRPSPLSTPTAAATGTPRPASATPRVTVTPSATVRPN